MMQSSNVSIIEPLLAVAAVRAKTRARRVRNEYRHSVTFNLAELDRRILHLRVHARTATAEVKEHFDVSLKAIGSSRDRLASDLRALDAATDSGWTAAKTALDRELFVLTALIEKG